MTRFDLLWVRLTRVLSFLAGLGIMIYETVWNHSDRPWLFAAAIGMMGLPVARAIERTAQLTGRVLERLAAESQQSKREEDPP